MNGLKRLLLTVLLLLGAPVAAAQTLTLHTMFGPSPANADRVMVSGEDGRWREVEGAGGVYTAQLEGARYSLAVTCFTPQGPTITVYRFLLDEVSSLQHTCPGQGDVLTTPTRVTGELRTGPSAGRVPNLASVYVGGRQVYSGVASEGATFGATMPPSAGADLLALDAALGEVPGRALLQRGADLADAPLLLDLTSEQALELVQYELAVADAESAMLENTTLTARLVTCGGLNAPVGAAVPAGSSRAAYAALPEAVREECDRYELTALATDATGMTLRLASAVLAEPTATELVLPEPVALPLIDTVGTDPLRARFTWQQEPGVLFYVGALTDGRVTWNFVQSAWLAPSMTVAPWGADVAAPDLRGGEFYWGFGAVRGAGGVDQVLRAYLQSSVTGQGGYWGPVTPGLAFQLYMTGGPWAPHATELPGSR
jgi:hypothetical protein